MLPIRRAALGMTDVARIAENIPEKPSIPMKIGLTITSLEKFHICAESNFLWYSHLFRGSRDSHAAR